MELQRLLRDERKEVLDRFAERVRALYSEPDEQAGQILDGVPALLDSVIASLDQRGAASGSTSASAGIGSDHGEQRFDLDINIVDMAREWTVLRDVILEVLLERHAAVDVEDYRRLSQQISAASIASIRRYVELNERERRRLAADHVSFVVHDLRNQMQCARTALDLLTRQIGESSTLDLLSESLVGLSHVMDRELTMSRLEALGTGLEVARHPVDLDRLVAAVVQETALMAKLRETRVVTTTAGDLVVTGDVRLLHSAIANLVGNAIKYTAAGSEIHVDAHRELDRIVIDVVDACGGLAPEVARSMFETHAHGGHARSGYGIGLTIAERAVAAHAGTISVVDRPGVGCRFRVCLPTAAAQAPEPGSVSPRV